MAKRSSTPPPPKEPARLLVPRADAAEKIQRQIDEGDAIHGLEIRSEEPLKSARRRRSEWVDFTKQLLNRLFSTDEMASEFNHAFSVGMFVLGGRRDLGEDVRDFRSGVERGVAKLRSIHRQLELFPDVPEVALPGLNFRQGFGASDGSVFVVHGHDGEAKQAVARFLEKLGLSPVILHEQPDRGRTIIEKFEHHSAVGFAVVLLTPDDVGAPKADPTNLRSRPRQNVVFELGYFLGALGRGHVCALVSTGVDIEMFSDYSGVLTIPFDVSGAWQLPLARELKAAGLAVDLNLAV
jgi:hypothetical protein